MATVLNDEITLIRYLINDTPFSISDIFTYNASNIFTLTEINPISVSEVLVNDVSSGITHSYNSITKKVYITSPLTSGDTIEIQYTCFRDYSDSEIKSYIRSALMYLSIHNYTTYTIDELDEEIYPDLTDEEKNLVAMITGLLIEPNNKTIHLPNITITVPNDDPVEKKIGKLIMAFKRKGKLGEFDII